MSFRLYVFPSLRLSAITNGAIGLATLATKHKKAPSLMPNYHF